MKPKPRLANPTSHIQSGRSVAQLLGTLFPKGLRRTPYDNGLQAEART